MSATRATYIKLGQGGSLERRCLEEGTLRADYREVSHEVALHDSVEEIAACFHLAGNKGGVATRKANQLLELYRHDPERLWITFSDGYLWWCKTKPNVVALNGSPGSIDQHGLRILQTIDGWHKNDIHGVPLEMATMNGHLTRTAASRSPICNVEAFDYLLRKINGEKVKQVWVLEDHKAEMLKLIADVIRLLTFKDFELLVELIFATSGWRRIGATGGSQKTVDLELMLPSTGERAFVQVKSRTDQQTLNAYTNAFKARGEDRMFFAYHTCKRPLHTVDETITLLGPERLSGMALNAGLVDWLIEKTS